MATKTRYWTRDDLADLPDDGNRYEVLDGALLVTPQASPDHQRTAFLVAMRLEDYCARHRIGVVVGPGAVPVGKDELQPDVQVIPMESYQPGRAWTELSLPLLVVEVRSDSTYRRDIGIKRRAYQRFGIQDYWFIDPEERCAMVWTSNREDPVAVRDKLQWKPSADIPALEIPLASVFPGAASG